MKGLIIKKEHLDKIFDGGKCFEMRTTRTKTRGPIRLIESGSGLIMGEAQLIDCLEPFKDAEEAEIYRDCHQVDDFRLLEKWRFIWVLDYRKRYDKPIPYKHPQGAVIWVNLVGMGAD